MFDLETQIQSWRKTVSRDLPNQSETIDELESHLRDEIDRLSSAGRPTQEAFEAAVARIGDPRTIAGEFSKTTSPAWLPARLSFAATIGLAIVMLVFVGIRMARGRITPVLGTHVFAVSIGYIASLACGITAVVAIVSRAVGGLTPRQSRAFRAAGVRLASSAALLTLVGIVLGMIWSSDHLGRAWGWDAKEIGGLCVLASNCLLLSCLRWRTVPIESALVGGVIGNVIVILGWFGPVLLNATEAPHLAAWYWYRSALCIVIMVHLVLIYASLLPPGWIRANRAAS